MPKLVLIPTPIGNLEDITLRALRMLKECFCLYAEDTRTAGMLLKHYEIKANLRAFHIHNEHKLASQIAKDLKSQPEEVIFGLVSDAGTPAISDPGFLLVKACLEEGIEVECLPGATAFVPALVKSGIPCSHFSFYGFLPQKKGRVTLLTKMAEQEGGAIVIYEAPHRMIKLLEQMLPIFGEERIISVSREISKKFEETINGTVVHAKNHFELHPPKGEFVLVIQGK